MKTINELEKYIESNNYIYGGNINKYSEELLKIQNSLDDTEQIDFLYASDCVLVGRTTMGLGQGVVSISNKQILCATKRTKGILKNSMLTAVKPNQFNDIQKINRNKKGSYFIIDCLTEKIHFWVNKEHEDEVYSIIQRLLENLKNNKIDNNSNIEEIKKFKELLDNEIITQEEFDKKKKELLGL